LANTVLPIWPVNVRPYSDMAGTVKTGNPSAANRTSGLDFFRHPCRDHANYRSKRSPSFLEQPGHPIVMRRLSVRRRHLRLGQTQVSEYQQSDR
jgi:hypothetical protein